MSAKSKHDRQEALAAAVEGEIHQNEVDGTLSGFIDDRASGFCGPNTPSRWGRPSQYNRQPVVESVETQAPGGNEPVVFTVA